jgi:hypothetical protein
VVTEIPANAMLQRADLALGGEPLEYGPRTLSDTVKLQLCSGAYPSAALIKASRGVAGAAALAQTPPNPAGLYSTVEEQVNAYRTGGAAQFMTELRDRVNRCPGTLGENRSRWTVVGTDLGGDESLLLERKWLTRYPDAQAPLSEARHYVGVVHTGSLVVIVVSVGWETDYGHAAVVRQFVPVALQRLAPMR